MTTQINLDQLKPILAADGKQQTIAIGWVKHREPITEREEELFNKMSEFQDLSQMIGEDEQILYHIKEQIISRFGGTQKSFYRVKLGDTQDGNSFITFHQLTSHLTQDTPKTQSNYLQDLINAGKKGQVNYLKTPSNGWPNSFLDKLKEHFDIITVAEGIVIKLK